MKRALGGREQGQAAIEFAGIIVPFMLLFLIICDGGLYFATYVTATNAVREGARCGVVGGSDAAVTSLVDDKLTAVDGSSSVTRGAKTGDELTVEADWTYSWITPLELFGFGGTTTRTSRETMRLETDDEDKTCPPGGP